MPLASTRPLLGADWLDVTVSSRMSLVGSGNFGLLLLVLVADFSTKGLQAPTRRAVRLGSGDGEDCHRRELIDVPRRGARARRAVHLGESRLAGPRGPTPPGR